MVSDARVRPGADNKVTISDGELITDAQKDREIAS